MKKTFAIEAKVLEENDETKKRIVSLRSSGPSASRDASQGNPIADSFEFAHRRVSERLLKASSVPMREHNCAASLNKRTLILVSGKDAITFLDGLTTNDLAGAMRLSRVVSTAFLTPQGALEHLCLAFPTADGVILECERARLKDFAARLWRARMDCSVSFCWLQELKVASIFPTDNSYEGSLKATGKVAEKVAEKIAAQVDVKATARVTSRVTSLGSELAAGFLFRDPRAPLDAWRLWHGRGGEVARAAGLPIASLSDYEDYRLSLGVVENSEEFAQPRAFPFEYGLDALATLSWEKACYVGQEITARMKYRARATKKHVFALRVAANSAEAVQRGDKIYSVAGGETSQSQVGKLCGEIVYAVGTSSGSSSDASVGETAGETTVLALCNLARLREACLDSLSLDGLPLVVTASSREHSPTKNLAARLLVPSWLTTLFSRKHGSSSHPPAEVQLGRESHKRYLPVAGRAVSLLPVLLLALLFFLPTALAQGSLELENLHAQSLKVQKPYRLSVFARAKGARSLAVAEEIGSVFISTRGSRLYAVKDGKTHLLANNLNVANGIVWRAPYLYVVEQDKVSRHRFDEFQPRLAKSQEANGGVLFDKLPNKRHHGWRVATIGPDSRLYIAIGAPCNICSVTGLEGTIIRMALDGSGVEVYASGVRNSIGLDFQPSSGTLFFTDNGADFMGDDSPPEEVNHALRAGMFFGYPWFGGGRDRTEEFANRALPQTNGSVVSFPIATFTAHSAPLGIHFYRGEKFKDLQGDAFVALHGSWNRSSPSGYKVMRLHFSAGELEPRQSVFIDGFLRMRGGQGRPVDVKTHWDGSLLISDDKRGLVYRLERFEGEQ